MPHKSQDSEVPDPEIRGFGVFSLIVLTALCGFVFALFRWYPLGTASLLALLILLFSAHVFSTGLGHRQMHRQGIVRRPRPPLPTRSTPEQTDQDPVADEPSAWTHRLTVAGFAAGVWLGSALLIADGSSHESAGGVIVAGSSTGVLGAFAAFGLCRLATVCVGFVRQSGEA
jgi:hypothetical protein